METLALQKANKDRRIEEMEARVAKLEERIAEMNAAFLIGRFPPQARP